MERRDKNKEFKHVPRGVRNNNPLNIKKGQKWKGLSSIQTDSVFCQFDSMVMGYRAAFVILGKSYRKRGIRRLVDMVKTWAPSSENNTLAYYRFVADTLRKEFRDDEHLADCIDGDFPRPNAKNKAYWCCLVKAMHLVENGAWPADGACIAKAFDKVFLT